MSNLSSFYFSPGKYIWPNTPTSRIINKYSFFGIGYKTNKVIFTEGINEKGLSVFTSKLENNVNLNSCLEKVVHRIDEQDMCNFLLGNCGDLAETLQLLKYTYIKNINSYLSWIIADRSGKILVITGSQSGVQIISQQEFKPSLSKGYSLTKLC